MKITVWHPEERRSYVIYDWDGNVLEEGPTLSAEEVYCDLCNEEVILRPVPVVEGYALCDNCMPKLVPDWYDQVLNRPDGADILEAWYEQRYERRFKNKASE